MATSGRRTEKAHQRKVTSQGVRPKARRATGSAHFPNLAILVEGGGILGVAYQSGRYILSAVIPNDTGREPTSAVLTYDSLDDAVGEMEAFAARCTPQRLVDAAGGGRAKVSAKKRAGKAAASEPPKAASSEPPKAAPKGSKAAKKAGGKAPAAKRGVSKAPAARRTPGR